MAKGYKVEKEAFVSGMTGSSMLHINLISLVALISISLYAAIKTRFIPTRESPGFLPSWTILVLPLLLSMTIFAQNPIYLAGILLAPTIFILRIPRPESGTPLPSSQPASPSVEHATPPYIMSTTTNPTSVGTKITPLPALTTYRAHMMLMTVLAILAVDFSVFPRSLVKCETFGVSLMDLGVGSFVFSQGIVSAIPLIKDPYYVTSPFLRKLVKVTSKSLPIIALGVVRVLLVKGTEYPEHITEYGLHWNFFITLALLPVLQVLLHPVIQRFSISLVGVIIALLQQILLSRFGLKDYVLHAPRASIISQNKEGIVSLLGYLSIQLLGLSVGTLILPPTPSFYRRRQEIMLSQDKKRNRRDSNASSSNTNTTTAQTPPNKTLATFSLAAPRQTDKTATELCAYSILWWTCLGALRLVGVDGKWDTDGGVSRRMVNVSYIFWITAFNTSFVLCYVLLDLWVFTNGSHPSKKKKQQGKRPSAASEDEEDDSAEERKKVNKDMMFLSVPDNARTKRGGTPSNTVLGNPPKLLDDINNNGLFVFLAANVFTGLVNLSIQTMYVGDMTAMTILSLYSLGVCAIGSVGYSGIVGKVMGRKRAGSRTGTFKNL